MNHDQVADLVISKLNETEEKISELKESTRNLFAWFLQSVKDIVGEMPTEEEFLTVLAKLIDKLVVLPPPFEWFDDTAAKVILKVIDCNLLDRLIGPDWYEKLKEKIT